MVRQFLRILSAIDLNGEDHISAPIIANEKRRRVPTPTSAGKSVQAAQTLTIMLMATVMEFCHFFG
jgi:hypothetical protein